MPTKVLFFLMLACLAPLRLAAEEHPTERYVSPAAAKQAPPRRLSGDEGRPTGRNRATAEEADSKIQQASFAESDLPAEKKSNLSLRKSGRGRALTPRGDGAGARQAQAKDRVRPAGTASSVMTGLASLAVVLGLFFAVAWALRRGMPPGAAMLPREAVEVLGKTPLAGRQHAHLLRCGNKILLVYLAQGVAETLTEITDPLEVDRLVGLCRQSHPQSTTASFRQILQQFGRGKGEG